MSLNSVPSKEEVMGWNPQSLADYMRRLKLSGCDRLVIKSSINGAQFMQMTACDLQVFPSLYIPILTKIQNEINKMDQKKGGFGLKSKAQKYPKQVFVQEELWDSDEFDNDSDHDYESSNQEEQEDSYICTLTEPQTAEQEDSDEAYEDGCDEPPSADIMKPLRLPGLAKHQDSHYRDPVHEPTPAERTSKPPHPQPPRMSHTPQRPFKAPAPASQPNLLIDRSKKPGHSGPSQTDLKKSKGSTDRAPGSSTSRTPKPRPPKHTDVASRADKPVPPVPAELCQVKNSIPGPRKGLDPSWYGGKVTRHQAEAALREVNKDGAFVVRDSTKGAVEHPYTLMLLKEGRVYNIMIRNQGNSYSLGTGLKNTKSFPGVKEMITHHTHTPLLLIDATDQSSEAPSRCCLLHPAGL